MTFLGQFARILYGDKGRIEVTFVTWNKSSVEALNALSDSTLDVTVRKHKERRSLDANAYFWTLAQKLAVVLSVRDERPVSKTEIYRQYIKDIGAHKIVPIAEEDVERWTEIWTHSGEGWIIEDMGPSKLPGYRNLRCYYGSSVYDYKQMKRLIELAIADCKELGIETRTPDEIANMLSLWDKVKK